MPVVELYSSRTKPKYPDVYQYEQASYKLRNQLQQILISAIGSAPYYGVERPSTSVYQYLFDTLSREYGLSHLAGHTSGDCQWLADYMTSKFTSTLELLDLLDLACTVIDTHVRKRWKTFSCQDNATQKPDDAIYEINERMKRDGFGFEFTDGKIIKIDEQFIHSEVVKPALYILNDFEVAKDEFLSAHEHYRHRAFEESIVDCCKSLESLLKTICHDRGWINDRELEKLTAQKLIMKCFENGLIPHYLQTQFTSLQQLLESGVPTVRNKEGGHGAGKHARDIPEHLASYTLHLTATNIVFLGKCALEVD